MRQPREKFVLGVFAALCLGPFTLSVATQPIRDPQHWPWRTIWVQSFATVSPDAEMARKTFEGEVKLANPKFKGDNSGISNYLQRWDGKRWVTVDKVERSVGP